MRLHFSPRSLSAYHKPSLTHLTPTIPLPPFHPSSPVNLAPSSPCMLSPANLPPTPPYPQFHFHCLRAVCVLLQAHTDYVLLFFYFMILSYFSIFTLFTKCMVSSMNKIKYQINFCY